LLAQSLRKRYRLWAAIAIACGLAFIILTQHSNLYRPGYGCYFGLARLMNEPLDLAIARFDNNAFRDRRQSVLICPAHICTAAEKIDLQPPVFNVSAQVLFQRLDQIIMAEPGAGAAYLPPTDELRRRYILRSPIFGLPENIEMRVVSIDATHATFALYARDLIRELAPDRSQRTARWLAALRADG
jgi:hypothetical protein